MMLASAYALYQMFGSLNASYRHMLNLATPDRQPIVRYNSVPPRKRLGDAKSPPFICSLQLSRALRGLPLGV